ncbi:MAG TPA: YfiR family protein [Ohtaekwangia sp.]|nr:YfiR family protein [Ohtaekwangia sp.]
MKLFTVFLEHAEKIMRICFSFFIVTVLMALTASPFQGKEVVRENKVKAVFVYNFTQFIEWPAESFEDTTASFVIGILGDDTFGKYLSEAIEGEKVNGHPIVMKNFRTLTNDIQKCHILFIAKSFPAYDKVLTLTTGKPVLTVSDHEKFMKLNGILKFYRDNGNIRFEINREESLKAGLQISPKLLRLAAIYTEG